ncbi:probable 3',5'-cyclic phosphodiesterase pde-5 isoform X2 [Pomacea canaliculata]|uniref:probable 3',5'-cyclic phosphodiesterase pde-5 isoform X2 n=1 Tax=Pomacea canaliculata TaxID=400727 RepID=UPI000D732ACF|nr:probable 3',5'-cyclic phosphodiesterase pde-5 isoform X2 [Pomacea canaliculata]
MSSPVRQIASRRLPPLQGAGANTRLSSNRWRPRIPHNSSDPRRGAHRSHQSQTLQDMFVTGYSVVSQAPHVISGHGYAYGIANGDDLRPQDLTPELVTQYLQQNPEFLEHHVTAYVNTEQIERWLQRKTNVSSRAGNRYRLDHHTLNECQGCVPCKTLRHDTVSLTGEVTTEARTSSLSKWKSRIQSSKGRVLQELSKEMNQQHGKLAVLLELSACVSAAVCADGHNLYAVDENKEEISHIFTDSSGQIVQGRTEKTRYRATVASHVAYSKEPVRLKDLAMDRRFPDGLGVGSNRAHSVLALPITDGNCVVLGAVEFYRYSKYSHFTEEEEEVASTLMALGSTALFYAEMHNSMTRQRKLNEFLLAVTKSVFQDIVSMDSVIMKIMNYAQKLVSADRASLFLLDHKSRELYARIFDVGSAQGFVSDERQHKEIRFPMDKGVAGHVASTGEVLNIKDAYSDNRFNRDVDLQTGYRTQTILCMPIYIRGSIIGVVQMVNKLSGSFTRNDEEAFETFAIYCGLALHHAKLYDKVRRSEQKYRVALEVLSYHSQCTEQELNALKAEPIPDNIPSITDYTFSPWSVEDNKKPLQVLYMLRDLFSPMRTSNREQRFDTTDLMRFTLTVRKNYRNVPYHNWVHAFSVAHSMYTVVKTCQHQLTHLECLALFVACLCHDLDHRGKTNAFMVKSATPLAAVYSTSTMEHHHFNQTVTILQHEGHNIFKHLTSDEYKKVLSDIRHCILATDLALFFPNRARLKDIVAKQGFSWNADEHRDLLMGISMTACDLCAMYKPWRTQLDLVYVIMEEFWQQGDEEKLKGMTPMAMMDRDKKDELPQLEVGFITSICLPCYELLGNVLPETHPMLEGVRENLSHWEELAKQQKHPEDLLDTVSSQKNGLKMGKDLGESYPAKVKPMEHDSDDSKNVDDIDNKLNVTGHTDEQDSTFATEGKVSPTGQS